MSMFKLSDFIRYVSDGFCLSIDYSYEIAKKMLNKELSDIQIASILTALRIKGECASEIVGFVKVLKENCVKIEINVPAIDTAGTGGDGFGTINVSTIAAIITAAAGGYVLKHGNKAVSSSSGSADFLETLGYNIYHNPEQVKKMIEKTRFAFVYAPLYHPLMKNIAHIRKELGFRTIFNLVGPLSNPGNVKRQLLGISDRKYFDIYAEACKLLDYDHVIIVHGEPGIDEVSIFGKTIIYEVKKNKVDIYEIEPIDFKLPKFDIKDVIVKSPIESVQKILNAIKPNSKLNAVKAFIAINSGFAIYLSGIVKDPFDGFEYCLKLIDDGIVEKYINELVKLSKEV